MRPLTPKQQAFVAEYAKDLNSVQAAIRAGYSKRTANKIGPELLGKTSIKNAIAATTKEKARRSKISVAWVLKRLVLEATGKTKDTKQSARVKALETLARHLGMLKEKIEVTGKDGGPIETSDMTEEERAKRLMVLLRRHHERISSVPVGRDDPAAIGSDDAGGASGSV